MKLFLIKIGKAFSVLKRDGMIRGGGRVVRAFFSLFRVVGSGDILFITNGVGDSALYRSHHVAEELELHGFQCSVTVQDNPFLVGYANKFKIFVFHRTLFDLKIKNLLKEIKKQNKEIIFDADDLVFDSGYIKQMDFFNKLNSLEKKLYENGLGGEILNDSYVKYCTTTTSYLAKKLQEKNKKVFIVSNKLSQRDLMVTDKILLKEKNKNNGIKIGYFSGTASHNKDFATIVDVLMQIMEKYSQVKLLLAGPLDIENKLNKYKNRIIQLPYVPREKYFDNIYLADINIAPLEMGNPFCESKSELKFFETGILKVPTVAVANQTFSEAIKDGVDGFLAKNDNEWFEKLEKLIIDEQLRKSMGAKAREKILQKYTNKNSNNEEYYNYLKSKI